jgi:gliding motility-associated-like protein
MKRIIYSCFLLILILFSKNIIAQPMSATLTSVQCFTPGANFATGVVTNTSPSAPGGTYIWVSVTSPPGATCAPTQTLPVPSGTACNFSFPCCGVYVFNCFAIPNGGGAPVDQVVLSITIECPSFGTVTPASPSICAGNPASFSITGGSTWSWTPVSPPGPTVVTGGVFTPTPLATTCYTANGVTINGCTVTIPAAACVTVQSLNVNIAPPSQTICAGTQLTLTANTSAAPDPVVAYQWYEIAPLTVLGGTLSTEVVSPTVTTTYSLNAFVSTCSVSLTNSITVGPNLSLLASASSASVCPPEQFTLTANSSATSFSWTQISGPGTANFNASTASNTLNPTIGIGPGTYSVIGSNSVCTSAPFTVTVLPTSFVPGVTTSSAAVCAGQPFTLTANGGAPNSYTFGTINPLPPTVICSSCGPVQTVTQNTTTTYAVLATSTAGCQNSVTISVGIIPPTTVAIVASSASVCAASPVTLTASGAINYTIVSSTAGTISIASSSVPLVVVDSPTANTTYTVYGTNSGSFCISTAVVSVSMTLGGSLTLTTTSTNSIICSGQSSSLSALGALSYSWTLGTSTTAVTGASFVASPTVTTVYSVTGSNNGGCVGFSTITVSVSTTPTIFITSNPTGSFVCANFASTLTANGAVNYTWTGSNFSIPVNQPSISVTPGTTPGQFNTFTVIGGSAGANCPSLPRFFTLFVAPPLNIQVTRAPIQGTTCIEFNFNPGKRSKPVTLTASGAQNYVWFPYNPAFMTYSLGAQTQVRPPASTCYTVTGYTQNCSGTAVVCVSVIPQFTMNVVPPLPAICLGDSIRLSIVNIQTLAVGPSSLFTYYWNDPPTSPPPSITAQNTPTVISFPQTTTTYSVEVFDARLCASLPRLVTVTVLPQPLTGISLPIINNVPTNTVCFVGDLPGAPDNKLDLTAYNANINLPFGVTPTYTWTGPDKPQSVVTPSNLSQVTVIAPKRLPSVVVFTVATGFNGVSGCKRIDTISVRVIDCRPVNSNSVTFIMDIDNTDTICSRDCITFLATTDTLAGGPQTYSWTFKGGSPATSTDKSPTVCYNLPSNQTGWDVVLKVSNPYPVFETPSGSSAVKSFYGYIRVLDVPNVTIIAPGQRKSDTAIKFNQSIVLTATNALTYTWSPKYSISAVTGSVVTVNPTKTTQYIVTGRNSKRCFSSDTINVNVFEDCGDMFVPNAFSPNDDNVNDVLLVRGVCLETLTFMVFNRWGEKVFETNDVNVGWDGTFNGEKMNTGVFVYRLEGKTYEGKGFSLKGNITLMR